MEPREKAALLPETPGVYLFKDAGGTVLYVGKARNLRSRVRSYFLESRWADAKTGSLAREIADWRRFSSAMSAKPWRSNTTSSSNTARNSTSCFEMTKRIPTSNSRR